MLRFSLLTLLGVVLVAAVGSAALANPTDTWCQVIVTGTVGILAAATLAATANRRASGFGRGFAVAGWLYVALVFGGVFGLREHLLTEQAAGWLYERIHGNDDVPSPLPAPALYGGTYSPSDSALSIGARATRFPASYQPLHHQVRTSSLPSPMPSGTVKNYMTEAILCLLCCGGIFAVPAIVYAAQVNPKLQAGDYDGAVQAPNSAKNWCIVAFCIGLTCGGIGVILQLMAVANSGTF